MADLPPLEPAGWAPTKRTLHLIAQMLGKVRLALSPHQPNFLFTALYLTPRGFTTGLIPAGAQVIELHVDVLEARIAIASSDERRYDVDFGGFRTIGSVFRELRDALSRLGVTVSLSPIPQEIPDRTPLDADERRAVCEPSDARRWLAVIAATHGVFDRWRAHFFGRTGLQLWWGAFDYSLMLFSGKHVDPPADRGYLFKYDLDAELMNAGFYPGDETNEPYYYGYVYPAPPQCGTFAMQPPGAAWSERLGEWVLPYETVRTSKDPGAALTAFLDAIYGVCRGPASWDTEHLTYAPPPLRRAP